MHMTLLCLLLYHFSFFLFLLLDLDILQRTYGRARYRVLSNS